MFMDICGVICMFIGVGIEIQVRKFKYLNVKFKGFMIYIYKIIWNVRYFVVDFEFD